MAESVIESQDVFRKDCGNPEAASGVIDIRLFPQVICSEPL